VDKVNNKSATYWYARVLAWASVPLICASVSLIVLRFVFSESLGDFFSPKVLLLPIAISIFFEYFFIRIAFFKQINIRTERLFWLISVCIFLLICLGWLVWVIIPYKFSYESVWGEFYWILYLVTSIYALKLVNNIPSFRKK
jgi:hypothetical protein